MYAGYPNPTDYGECALCGKGYELDAGFKGLCPGCTWEWDYQMAQDALAERGKEKA